MKEYLKKRSLDFMQAERMVHEDTAYKKKCGCTNKNGTPQSCVNRVLDLTLSGKAGFFFLLL